MKNFFTLPNPFETDCNITVEILSGGKNKIKSSISSGTATFDIDIKLKCNVEAVQSKADYSLSQNADMLEKYIEYFLISEMKNFMTRVQKEYDADILKFGNKAAHNFLTVSDWENYNWRDKYKDAKINFNVNLNIENIANTLP